MKGREAMSSIDPSNSAPRSRKRLAAWLAFGAIGLATGAVWASGFGTATAVNGTTDVSPALAKAAPAVASNALAGKVTKIADLTYDWEGRWGSIAADTTMFKVDLRHAPRAQHLQPRAARRQHHADDRLGLHAARGRAHRRRPAAGVCGAASYTHSGPEAQILHFNDQDGGVYWPAVPGNAVYCIGVSDSTGDVATGTFLRGAQDAAPTVFPTFIATVDRAS